MKAIIFGWLDFPRGSATANYIQYLGLALKEMGYNVYIVTNRPEKASTHLSKCKWKGLNIRYYEIHNDKLRHYVDFNFRRGNIYAQVVQEIGLCQDDLLISYCQDYLEFVPLLKHAKKCRCRTVACITEYFPKSEIKGILQKISYTRALKKYIPEHDYILPISSYIKNKYPNNRAFVLPIMADVQEYPYKSKKYNGKIRVVYPANGKMKDSLKSMLEAVAHISPNYNDRLELHLTNVSVELLKEYDIENLDKLLNEIIIPHGWLDYDELVSLYQSCHFLLLAREENQMNMANFPSKVPEAMTYGVIPIVSEVGDYTKYYLSDGDNAIVFKGHSELECIDALNKAFSLSQKKMIFMSEAARKTAEEKFDYRNWTEKLKKFLI